VPQPHRRLASPEQLSRAAEAGPRAGVALLHVRTGTAIPQLREVVVRRGWRPGLPRHRSDAPGDLPPADPAICVTFAGAAAATLLSTR
jgi:hypothetical protein